MKHIDIKSVAENERCSIAVFGENLDSVNFSSDGGKDLIKMYKGTSFWFLKVNIALSWITLYLRKAITFSSVCKSDLIEMTVFCRSSEFLYLVTKSFLPVIFSV